MYVELLLVLQKNVDVLLSTPTPDTIYNCTSIGMNTINVVIAHYYIFVIVEPQWAHL